MRRRSIPSVLLAAALLLATAMPAGASASAPRLLQFDSSSHFTVRPATLSFGVGGGLLVLGPGVSQTAFRAGHDGHIRWTRWNATSARGLGTVWIDQCRPSCAAGKYATYPVTAQASQVVNGRYTRLMLSYRHGNQPKVLRFRLKRFGSFYGWQ